MDLQFLRPLYSQVGGYVSVYLDTSRAHENAPGEVELRWRAAWERLAAAGAGEATLEALGEVVTSPEVGAPGCAAFARGGAVAFTAPLAAPPRRQIARLALLPHVMPLLAQQPPRVPHLLVAANRAGGEVMAVSGYGGEQAQSASARGWPVHKVSTGGWSQARYQRSAETAWDENAKELASLVADTAAQARAQQIVVGGDARARALLFDHLTAPLQAETITVDSEVPADSPAMVQAAGEAIRAHIERQVRERFAHWETQRHHGGAVEGLADTLAALRDGKVASLFLADRPSSTATAWIAPDSGDLAPSQAELSEPGAASPVPERADAAVVRSLTTTGAELHFLPEDLVRTGEPGALGGIGHPRDGICATLRWPQQG